MKAIAATSLALALGLGIAVGVGAPAAHGATGRGYVDPTYGSNGSFTASPSLGGVTAMYAQPDGKVVFGGPISGGAELYRLNTDGTPARTFSGAIEVVEEGTSRGLDGPDFDRIAVYRFRADGSRDTSLGGDGGASAPGYIPLTAAIRYNGAVTFAYERFQQNVWGLGQLASGGAWDTSFSGDGRLDLGTNEVVRGFAIDSSGRILFRDDHVYPTFSSTLDRLTPNGNFDSAFGTGGRTGLAQPAADSETPSEILPTPSGRIYVAVHGDTTSVVIAFTSAGRLDTSLARARWASRPKTGSR